MLGNRYNYICQIFGIVGQSSVCPNTDFLNYSSRLRSIRALRRCLYPHITILSISWSISLITLYNTFILINQLCLNLSLVHSFLITMKRRQYNNNIDNDEEVYTTRNVFAYSRWTQLEDDKLKQAVEIYGDNCWKTISDYVGTRDNSKSALLYILWLIEWNYSFSHYFSNVHF